QPQSHPGRVLLRFRGRPADTPLWVCPVGAPAPVRKRSPARTPSQPPPPRSGGPPRSEARPGGKAPGACRVAAPPTVAQPDPTTPRTPAATGISCRTPAPGAKAEPSHTPEPSPSHPGRVLLPFRARPADTPLRVFHVGEPPPVRKRSPAITPSQPLRTRGGCSYRSEHAPPTRRYG